jgi:hypothetical protein
MIILHRQQEHIVWYRPGQRFWLIESHASTIDQSDERRQWKSHETGSHVPDYFLNFTFRGSLCIYLCKFIVCQHIDVEIYSKSDILSDSLRKSIDTANPSSFRPSWDIHYLPWKTASPSPVGRRTVALGIDSDSIFVLEIVLAITSPPNYAHRYRGFSATLQSGRSRWRSSARCPQHRWGWHGCLRIWWSRSSECRVTQQRISDIEELVNGKVCTSIPLRNTLFKKLAARRGNWSGWETTHLKS